MKKDYLDKIEKLEETLPKYIAENGPKNLKTKFPDKRKYFTKN